MCVGLLLNLLCFVPFHACNCVIVSAVLSCHSYFAQNINTTDSNIITGLRGSINTVIRVAVEVSPNVQLGPKMHQNEFDGRTLPRWWTISVVQDHSHRQREGREKKWKDGKMRWRRERRGRGESGKGDIVGFAVANKGTDATVGQK